MKKTSKREDNTLNCEQKMEIHWPDVGWFGLQLVPALVHVIQSVLEEHSFLWAAQRFDHLRLVPIHTLVDVIVGIDLSLDVLQIQKNRICFFRGNLIRWHTATSTVTPKIGLHSRPGCHSWLFMNVWFSCTWLVLWEFMVYCTQHF